MVNSVVAVIYQGTHKTYCRDKDMSVIAGQPNYVVYKNSGNLVCIRYDYVRFLVRDEGLVFDFSAIDSDSKNQVLIQHGVSNPRYASVFLTEDVNIDSLNKNTDFMEFVVNNKQRNKNGKYTREAGLAYKIELK